jgi:NADH dehydrogenase
VEGSSRILGQFPESLGASAEEQLAALGVEIRCQVKVQEITRGRVTFSTGETLEAGNIIWAAGVAASPLTARLETLTDRAGRVLVNPDLSVPGHPEIFVIGDAASLTDSKGQQVPGVSPAAMQAGRYVARLIEDELEGRPRRTPFNYWDKGSMATIGRSAAVAKIGGLEFSGYPAWLAWLLIHLVFLVGFRNRVAVLWQWFYSYVTYKRGARIITGLKS